MQTDKLLLQPTSILPQPVKVLAEWWNILNSWEWPDDLPGKPSNWNDLAFAYPPGHPNPSHYQCKLNWIAPIQAVIKDTIGFKECLRYHHIHNLARTDQQFEEWWAGEYFASHIAKLSPLVQKGGDQAL